MTQTLVENRQTCVKIQTLKYVLRVPTAQRIHPINNLKAPAELRGIAKVELEYFTAEHNCKKSFSSAFYPFFTVVILVLTEISTSL